MAGTRSSRATRDASASDWLTAVGQGLSQIFFQSNLVTGVLILAAFVVADWRMAVLVLLGSATGAVVGRLRGVPQKDVTAGMEGFCGALVGAATFSILGGQWESYPIAVAGAALCGPVIWAVQTLFARPPLKQYGLPSTTAPFCIVATLILVCTVPIHAKAAAETTTDSTTVAFFRSLLSNVSQVVLVDNPWAGALILIGLFVANWRVGLAAVLGSAIGSLSALAMDETLTETENGLAGYSGVLTAIALAVVLLKNSPTSWALAVIGTIVTAVVTLLMHRADVPTYTWPYILTTWVFLVIAHYLPSAKRT
ncbi:urea transporter [Aeromicrobium chenweiae]|uniref:Urea transporter n=1 Tax=Aeromicrobium chenweiae TaxID=2079793 RepID=A0A2S0WM35_9ACTN|nr:urea transporter [Aeromicrobium chenweiae]AWB92330.1 urea transporter [Aeromicrobium chenweiae]TGN31384.1 urea transporter [Aeromicrobium chenweiae]